MIYLLLTFPDNLADYKQLRGGIYFVQSLFFTPSGKVIRRSVRDMAIKMHKYAADDTDSI